DYDVARPGTLRDMRPSTRSVFISWSGARSKALAQSLRAWLPQVLPGLSPWLSSELLKGQRWFDVIGGRLPQSDIGLFCLTPESLRSTWMMFEAGALSKSLEHGQICPILLGLSADDLDGPLSQFQVTVFERSDMLNLVRALNTRLEREAISARALD